MVGSTLSYAFTAHQYSTFSELRYANQLGGSDMTGAADAIDEGLWRMSTFDSESCGASSVFLPVGKWVNSMFIFLCPSPLLTLLCLAADLNSTSQLHYAGSLMRLSILVSAV